MQATLTRSAMTANLAPNNRGGGVRVWQHTDGKTATLALTASAVRDNRAVGATGGGVFNDHGTTTLTDSTVDGNTAKQAGGLINERGTMRLTGSTVSNNTATDYEGGGLFNDGGGATLTVINTTISGNGAGQTSGGFHNFQGTATLIDSTISGNHAAGGGGIATYDGTLTLAFVTITGNVANAAATGGVNDVGGGIYRLSTAATIAVLSSIVAGNRRGASLADDCAGAITSQGRNLWGDQTACTNNVAGGDQNLFALNVALAAVLDPTLADNGGPTKTHNLVAGGAAVNKGDNVNCAAAPPSGPGGRDQRGVARTDGKCDVGAVEYTAPVASPSPSASPPPSASPSASPGLAPSFADVPVGYWAHDQISTFAQRGITTGCDTGLYCPERPVTRAEMAVFLDRTLGIPTPATPTGPRFTDVPPGYWAYAFIDRFATLGITTGCGGTEFCPDRGVTRAEMAAFLIRALKQPQVTPATPTFADVPASHAQFGYIEALVKLGVTTGCGTDDAGQRLYCPDRGVTRAEMAVFIIRAFP